MSLKESIPVVDILPVIYEESEYVEEDNSSEHIAEDLENREENISSFAEKNDVDDFTFDMSQLLTENHTSESTVEDKDQITENVFNLVEKNPSSVPAFYTSEQNLIISEHHPVKIDEKGCNDGKIPMIEADLLRFKENCTSSISDAEFEISLENVINSVKTDNSYNAPLKNDELEKSNLIKLQNDGTKTMKELGTTKIKPLCDIEHSLLNPVEEGEMRKELMSNKIDSNRMTNTTCHICEETEPPRGEYYAKGNVEKRVEVEEKALRKEKRKNFLLSENG